MNLPTKDKLFDLIHSLEKTEEFEFINALNQNLDEISYLKITQFNNSLEFESFIIKNKNKLPEKEFRNLIKAAGNLAVEIIIKENSRINNGPYYSITSRKLQTQKNIYLLNILHSRGLYNICNDLSNKIIEVASSYEFYDELVEGLLYKTKMLNEYRHFDKNEDYLNALNNIIEVRNKFLKSKLIMHKYDLSLMYTRDLTLLSLSLIDSILELNLYYNETKSINIKCFLIILQIELLRINKCFKMQSLIVKKLIEIIKSQKMVYSKFRLVFITTRMIESRIFSLEFTKAIKMFKTNELNRSDNNKSIYYRQFENYVLSLFFNENYSESIKIVQRIINNSLIEKFPIKLSIIKFYYSLGLFVLLKFKPCLSQINSIYEIQKDKSGWNVWIRILRLMCYLELKKYDLVDDEIESFRKYMERTKKKSHVSVRDELVLKVLMKLKLLGYDFDNFYKLHADLVLLLQSPINEYKWDVNSPEKILFHDWLLSKIEKRPYKPNFEPYRKQVAKDEELNEKRLRSLPNYDKLGLELDLTA